MANRVLLSVGGAVAGTAAVCVFLGPSLGRKVEGWMEDPAERDRQFRQRMGAVKERCDAMKAKWSKPDKEPGFWTKISLTSSYRQDEAVHKLRNQYEDLQNEKGLK